MLFSVYNNQFKIEQNLVVIWLNLDQLLQNDYIFFLKTSLKYLIGTQSIPKHSPCSLYLFL